MNKNQTYIAIFGLLFFLVLLLGLTNMLSNAVQKKGTSITPTDVLTAPTSSFRFPSNTPAPRGGTQADDSGDPVKKILSFNYPIRFDEIIIDYFEDRQKLIVYYPKDREQAQLTYRRFLNTYNASDSARLLINVEYIGLERDPSEPTPVPVE